jgi:RNA exonuclease 4
MLLFRRDKEMFEREHAKKWPAPTKPQANNSESGEKKARKKKKKKKK